MTLAERAGTDLSFPIAFYCSSPQHEGIPMKHARALAFAALTGLTLVSTGCAVIRGQETAGSYVDDTATTAAIKAKFVEDKIVSAGSINVETLNGVVQLSGFARTAAEKSKAEQIARNSRNVRSVRNDIIVRP
jgi:osmotically-inducible protein OsmY